MNLTGPGTSQRGLVFGGGQGFAVGRDTQSVHQEKSPRKHGPLVVSKCAATHVMYTRGTTSI